jgi:hypothetical protein
MDSSGTSTRLVASILRQGRPDRHLETGEVPRVKSGAGLGINGLGRFDLSAYQPD